jgi:hypothetical protein
MNDQEHFYLLFGPYVPPKIPRCRRLVCQMRGPLRVGSWSDGLIPWPRRYRTGSIILCGDLIRAVKMESVEAVCYYWGVCRNVVRKWRLAMNVPELNAGTKMLRRHMWSPHSAARQRAIIRGRNPQVLRHRENRNGRVRPLKRPETSLLLRRRMAETGRPLNPALRLWTDRENKLLGTAPDEDIARQIGRSKTAVKGRRNSFGIPAWNLSCFCPWSPEEDALLGVVPDRLLAKRLKRTFAAVQARRENKQLPPAHPQGGHSASRRLRAKSAQRRL